RGGGSFTDHFRGRHDFRVHGGRGGRLGGGFRFGLAFGCHGLFGRRRRRFDQVGVAVQDLRCLWLRGDRFGLGRRRGLRRCRRSFRLRGLGCLACFGRGGGLRRLRGVR